MHIDRAYLVNSNEMESSIYKTIDESDDRKQAIRKVEACLDVFNQWFEKREEAVCFNSSLERISRANTLYAATRHRHSAKGSGIRRYA